MALVPSGVSEECAERPWKVTSTRLLDLWPAITRIDVGSPTRQTRGGSARAPSASAIIAPPRQPTSSSKEKRQVQRLGEVGGGQVGQRGMITPMKAFMSAVPRP